MSGTQGKSRQLLWLIALMSPLLPAQEPLQLSMTRPLEGDPLAEVSFEGISGRVYRAQESQDLQAWHDRQLFVASDTSAHLSWTVPTTDTAAFFRVESVPLEPLASMVWIEPGTFVLGSPPDEEGRFLDKEGPQTEVTLTRGYWICRHEVTQGEFEEVLGFNPSLFAGDPDRPVEKVTWFDAMHYCYELTERERAAGRLAEEFAYRLPTEAEWAHAARSGTTTRFSYGDDPGYQLLSQYAWYGNNSGLRPHRVEGKLPNPWGLYDMHGNVFEWCLDWFGQLPGGSVTDPLGPSQGEDRIIRGGYWDSTPALCRSAVRVHFPPETKISYLGFRIVLAETMEP